MADEAHRSQYATFAENITVALPNATRIGFTGTPVEKADRSTRLVFGDYISVYRMRQAQEDHATVPIYYESRQIPLEIADPEQLAEVEEVLEGEEDEAAQQAGDRVGEAREGRRRPRSAGAARRRHPRALHAPAARCLTGKAMVVAYSPADRRRADRAAAGAVRRGGGRRA